MGALERLAEFDERTAITGDGERNRRNAKWIVLGQVLAFCAVVALLAVLRAFIPKGVTGAFIYFALSGAFLGAVGVYVIWRRRRNARLTGSPTNWAE